MSMIGRTISHYRITGEVGRGGMGVVYEAEDVKLGRRVAIKMLPAEITGDHDRVARFMREAQATSAINHPNIATIYEIDEVDGALFIAMEFIEGTTLRERIGPDGLGSDAVLDAARQLTVGLGRAHELGIVHRDIKPENVMLRPDGIVKILDFGLAKLTEETTASDETGQMPLTEAGMILGTARYMSPEQAQGLMVDARSDVFSAACVLYEMAVGRPAFPGDNRVAVQYAVVNTSPDPIPEDRGLPAGFADVVARGLAKAPDDRYPTCGEMAESLAGLGGSQPTGAAARATGSWTAATGVVSSSTETTASSHQSVTVLPFQNVTGSQDADWLRSGLQVMLSSDLAHTPTVRVVTPERLNEVLSDLRLENTALFDAVTVRSIAEYVSADAVVSGSYVKLGSTTRVDVLVSQPATGTEARVKVEAADDEELLASIAHIAAEVLRSIQSGAERDLVTTMVGEKGSRDPAAIRSYVDGLTKLHQGDNIEATALFERAIEMDPEFAMAYTYLGAALTNLGRDEEAAASLAKAVELSGDLPRTDRLFVAARQAVAAGEPARGIEALEELTTLLPNNLGAFYELALAHELVGNWDEATENLERVVSLDPKFGAALFALGRVQIKKGSSEKALEYLTGALSQSILSGNREAEATVLNAIGLAHYYLDRHDDALKHYRQSLEIKREIGDTRGMSATLSNMAVVYQVRGDFERSVSTYREALGLSEQIGDTQGLAENLINLGTVHEEKGQLDEALDCYKRALDIESELGDRMAEILCLNDIGNVYLTQGRIDDAQVYIERALDVRKEIGEKKGIGISLNCLGVIARLRGQYERALSKHLKALALFRETKWRTGEAETLAFMAAVMAARGRFTASLDSLEEAAGIYEELSDQTGLTVVRTTRADVECSLGRCEGALEQVVEVERDARELGNSELVAMALLTRGRLNRLLGDGEASVEILRSAIEAAAACGTRVTLFRVRIELGRALAARGGHAEATPLLMETLDEIRSLRLGSLLPEAGLAFAEALEAAGRSAEASGAAAEAAGEAERLGDRDTAVLAHALAGRNAEKVDERSRHLETARETFRAVSAELGEAGATYAKRPDLAAAMKRAADVS
ncbi:MAG: tetratricopeptide repeat protein [Candidatus Eisenbacteria bacterium]|nr:tetratricopeptide repeat protein [Candidatus Eisenbacteria bacterium]